MPSAPSPFAQSAVGELGANTAIDRGHGSERQKPVAGAGLNDQYRYAGPVFLRDQRHFAHPAAAASGGVKHRRAQQFGKRKGQHVFENTQLTGKNPHELCSVGVPPAPMGGQRPPGLPRVKKPSTAEGETPSGQPAGRRRYRGQIQLRVDISGAEGQTTAFAATACFPAMAM